MKTKWYCILEVSDDENGRQTKVGFFFKKLFYTV